MKNCRNCGAPHNNFKCDYCGTIYDDRFKNLKRVTKNENKLIGLTSTQKVILLIGALAFGVFVLKKMKR